MKICIVGLGARIAHVTALLCKANPDARLAGFVDPAPAGRASLEAATGQAMHAHATLEEMLKADQPDLLMVGSPNFMHLDHIRTALDHGTPHIFAEKPVVVSEDETFALLDALEKAGGHQRVMVGLVLRYAPLYRALRASLDSGQIGDVVSIEAAEHIGPYHGSFFMRDWRRHSRYSGGFMLEKCCHDLDLYQGVVGARAMRVASFGGRRSFVPENRPPEGTRFPRPETPGRVDPFEPRWNGGASDFDSDGDLVDHQTALIEYEGGANLCFHTNMYVPDEFRRFAVIGTKGMAEGDFIRNFYRAHDAVTGKRLVDMPDLGGTHDGHYGADEAMAQDLIAHMNGDLGLPVSVLDALEAGLTALKIDEARQRGAVIDLAPTWDRFDSYDVKRN
ncbi:Gfo/Idh/MocA family protein [Oceanomicrobium pacificus]|uniref:Gfo/Idh/MocA family oxidoreductase n=1 Tax=Oceanomicrobium pacificus TaxID=2692916 RepID=A0A6B0TZP6_9RHOB|nr:Gfo/Idh/MocA family oxidoreductase [Oceanomicrobium pacificus]MXU66732.1 Gfo/Idh/MocA family oxidoreductase [Oceanomicrobium pacificus]